MGRTEQIVLEWIGGFDLDEIECIRLGWGRGEGARSLTQSNSIRPILSDEIRFKLFVALPLSAIKSIAFITIFSILSIQLEIIQSNQIQI